MVLTWHGQAQAERTIYICADWNYDQRFHHRVLLDAHNVLLPPFMMHLRYERCHLMGKGWHSVGE